MRGGSFLPAYVTALVNSGCGEVVFYAKVLRPRLCPRHLAYAEDASAVRRHGRNHLMAVCVRQHNEGSRLRRAGMEEPFEAHRLFARCFSVKCRCVPAPGTWVELTREHWNRLQRLTAPHLLRAAGLAGEEEEAPPQAEA